MTSTGSGVLILTFSWPSCLSESFVDSHLVLSMKNYLCLGLNSSSKLLVLQFKHREGDFHSTSQQRRIDSWNHTGTGNLGKNSSVTCSTNTASCSTKSCATRDIFPPMYSLPSCGGLVHIPVSDRVGSAINVWFWHDVDYRPSIETRNPTKLTTVPRFCSSTKRQLVQNQRCVFGRFIRLFHRFASRLLRTPSWLGFQSSRRRGLCPLTVFETCMT